jgi:hypothetical protein
MRAQVARVELKLGHPAERAYFFLPPFFLPAFLAAFFLATVRPPLKVRAAGRLTLHLAAN